MRGLMVRYRQIGNHYYVWATDARESDALCSECHAPILWIVTNRGARMPLDVSRAEACDNGELRCVSHFATCPRAERFQDRKRQAKSSCPIDGCSGIVRRGELLCASCWKLVPKGHREEVWRCWKALRSGGGRAIARDYDRAFATAVAAAKVTKANRKVRQLDAFGDATLDPG